MTPDPDATPPALTDPLETLAALHGVATSYADWAGRPVAVSEETVRVVLGLLDVDASDPDAAVAADHERRLRQPLPATTVVTRGQAGVVRGSAPADAPLTAQVLLEGGGTVDVPVAAATVRADGRRDVTVSLPADLATGYHQLALTSGGESATAFLIVVPERVPPPAQRSWGWMLQLYALRSAGSWGLGDYADLHEVVRWSAQQGADVLLVNPLHAAAPTLPQQDSPYFPASRRFSAPLYLRPQALPEYAAAPADVRSRIDELGGAVPRADEIDRDACWLAKRAALELLYPYRVDRPGADPSPALDDFALWCAICELHGADWREWPAELHDPRGPAVAQLAGALAERVDVHRWLQHCCDEQLAAAQQSALECGMTTGIVHDLAVGVDPGGADAWALQRELAVGASVGAPPDSFNQQGQDWGLPPWRPDRLMETGYAPYREMVQAVLRRGGGLRVDHILGLFRLWWVPRGRSAAEGTFVAYDSDALLGILALEAERSGGLVVGEDLGTVPPEAAGALAARGVLGSVVLWFERDDPDEGAPRFLPPEQWRAAAMASVTTHDLPTAAGFLAAEHVRIRADLGVLGRPREDEAAAAAAQRAALIQLMRREGLVTGDDPEPAELVLAMHQLLVRSPAQVVLAALGDAVGDLRQPNLPGTTDAYPNWRLPIADAAGTALTWEQVRDDARVARLAQLLDRGVDPGPDPGTGPGAAR